MIRNRGDISHETLGYPSVNNSKLGRFYLLHNIHKQLHNVLGRPVISNSGIYTTNISPLLSIILNHLPKTLSRTLKRYNDFLCKLISLRPLPEDVIQFSIDNVGLYPTIPHDEGLITIRKALDFRKDKIIFFQE